MAIIDSQTAKGAQKGGLGSILRGYDAGKKIKGRKRHILVDTVGLLLNVVVHPADVQDRDGAFHLLRPGATNVPVHRAYFCRWRIRGTQDGPDRVAHRVSGDCKSSSDRDAAGFEGAVPNDGLSRGRLHGSAAIAAWLVTSSATRLLSSPSVRLAMIRIMLRRLAANPRHESILPRMGF